MVTLSKKEQKRAMGIAEVDRGEVRGREGVHMSLDTWVVRELTSRRKPGIM
jgi:hypothetical protein